MFNIKTLSLVAFIAASILSLPTVHAIDWGKAKFDKGATTVLPPTDSSLLTAPYRDSTRSIEERVEDLFSRLTNEEKAELTHGSSIFTIGNIPRIGLANVLTTDGPQGVHHRAGKPSTAFPCGLAMAASWNLPLMEDVGIALGNETKGTGSVMLLAPGLGMMRTPLNGRNFEYFGEDPFLSGKIAAAYIRGVQSEGVSTCIKHWILNDQEASRNTVSVEVGERALREIYVRPFEIAIQESNPWSVMNSYNRIRGQYSTENGPINAILSSEIKYDGAFISDWGAWHNDIKALNGGCSLCMPSSKNIDRNKTIAAKVADGTINAEIFNDAVKRNLRICFRMGLFDAIRHGTANAPGHQESGKKMARESMVLLKNSDRFLPLDPRKIKKIAVIGPNADEFHTNADGHVGDRGGSGTTKGPYEMTPLKAIVDRFGAENVIYAPGFRFGTPLKKSCPDLPETDPENAAKQADVVLFFGGISHGYDREYGDKPHNGLQGDQVTLIQKVIAANPKTVMILTSGSPVEVETWHEKIPAILESWYGGQDAGTVMGEILFGEVNPSGKLPCTFGKKLTDWACHSLGAIAYPGVKAKDAPYPTIFYSDYIWVGYRHFDRANIEPRYPFGFGLSYTSFKIEAVEGGSDGSFSVKVTNTGDRAGAEVVQCYLSKPDQNIIMPVRELAGFEKVFLNPGESKTVSFKITDELKRYWNEKENKWKIESGIYGISIGNSSRHLPVKYTLTQP